MRNRPFILIFLAIIHFLYPVYYVSQILYFHNISLVDFFSFIGIIYDPFQKVIFYSLIVTAIMLGYSILRVRSWAYWVLFIFVFLTITYNIAHYVKFYENDLIPPAIDLSVILVTFIITIYFLRKHVREPYFNPRLRWWENEERYRIEPIKVRIESVDRDKSFTENGEIFDLSEGGMFISCDFMPYVGTLLKMIFPFLGEMFSCEVRVVRLVDGAGRYPAGIGVKFTYILPSDKKKIKSYLKILDKKHLR